MQKKLLKGLLEFVIINTKNNVFYTFKELLQNKVNFFGCLVCSSYNLTTFKIS